MRAFFLTSLCLAGAFSARAEVIIPKKHSHLVEVITDSGKFYLTMYQQSPLAAANFLRNVESGFYDGLQVHHMVPGFVLQTGDRRTVGDHNAEYPLHVTQASYRTIKYMDVGMAQLENGKPSDKQLVFFLRDAREYRGEYPIFARVTQGKHILDRLTKGDRIRQMRILRYTSY